jgi:hypothetical protein
MIKAHANPSTKKAPPALNIAQGIINVALIIWAVRDIRRRDAAEIKGNRKFWLVAAFAPPIGPIAYFLFGRKRGAQTIEVQPEITTQP